MTGNNVANIPLLANAAQSLSRASSVAKLVPVKYWRMTAMAIALAWMCTTFVDLFWAVMPTPKMPAPVVVPSTGKVKSPKVGGKKIDVSALQALNLMGTFDPNAKTDEVEQAPTLTGAPVPKTKLNLELQGVIAGSQAKESWAIIGKAEAQKLYKIGDKVAKVRGVKIAEIFPTKVILDNNGKLEELWLYGKDGKDVGSAYVPPKRLSESEPKEEKKGTKSEIKQSDVMSVKSIGDVVRFMVATEDGKMVGYKVRPGRKRKLFDQVGLKTDDIVVSVNGIEVNEPQKVREVYQALKNATEADLEVMRDGNSHSIHISMSPEG